jgi:multiple sugar transport system permease protein
MLTANTRWIVASRNIAIIVALCAVAIVMLLPLAWLVTMSFSTLREAYKLPPRFLPSSLDPHNFVAVFGSTLPLLRIYGNSVVVAVGITAAQLVTCTLAGYALARLHFRGRSAVFGILIAGLMFPAQVTIIPIYLTYAKIGLADNPYALIILGLTSSFGVFLMRQFFIAQPRELEEAALMDAASPWKIFWRVSLPQAVPGASALAIVTFTQSWNAYFQPRFLLQSQESLTMPVAVGALKGFLGSGNIPVVTAALTLAILPAVVVFLFAQRAIIESVTMSGIRG